ncbi:MAG: hypothetical protein K2X91_19200, partial [Thermoleophilia bacterium]|nr:hypothetical protein [Thermoleophilia bacterium]
AEGRAGRVDRRSDVYGLGAILYEVLTDEPPFSDEDTAALLRRVRERPPARPCSVVPTADPALEAVCLKALSKDPDARYQTAPEFSAELQRWLAGEPVEAYDEPIAARVRRWIARHRTSVTAGAAAAAVALVTLGVATVLLAYGRDRERAARVLAVGQQKKARENFDTARRAVERYLTIVAETELLGRPGLQPLRERLLRAAMEYYKAFAIEHAQDASLQADLAAAYVRLGRITEEIGSKIEARGHYRRARDIMARLAEGGRVDPAAQAELSDCLNRLGNLAAALGDHGEAMEALGEARRLVAQRLGAAPSDVRIRSQLAGIENNLGNVQRDAGRAAEALESYRRARHEFGLLALGTSEADEAGTGYRTSVAGTDQNLGVLLFELGRLDDALEALE